MSYDADNGRNNCHKQLWSVKEARLKICICMTPLIYHRTSWERQQQQDGEQIPGCQGLGRGTYLAPQLRWWVRESAQVCVKIHKTTHPSPNSNFAAHYFKNDRHVNYREKTKLRFTILQKNKLIKNLFIFTQKSHFQEFILKESLWMGTKNLLERKFIMASLYRKTKKNQNIQ